MSKQSLPSIEEFAAYLDGNLPLSEIQRLSKLAEQNDAFQQLLEANSVIDDTIAGFNYTDLQLPPEIDEVHFEMPFIAEDDMSELVNLTPESTDNSVSVITASAASVNMDDSLNEITDKNSDLFDDSSVPFNDEIECAGDVTETISNDF